MRWTLFILLALSFVGTSSFATGLSGLKISTSKDNHARIWTVSGITEEKFKNEWLDADGNTVGLDDPAAQVRQCFETIESCLSEAGASMSDVVRTRMLLTRISDWEEIAKVRGEYFREILPVDTVMQVSSFINPDWLVEVEVDAVIDQEE